MILDSQQYNQGVHRTRVLLQSWGSWANKSSVWGFMDTQKYSQGFLDTQEYIPRGLRTHKNIISAFLDTQVHTQTRVVQITQKYIKDFPGNTKIMSAAS